MKAPFQSQFIASQGTTSSPGEDIVTPYLHTCTICIEHRSVGNPQKSLENLAHVRSEKGMMAYSASSLQPGEAVWLCPPPSDIMASSLVTRVQEKAERVAQQLGLSGLASLQGYINADSGDLRVIDVDTSPPLQASSTIFAQVSILLSI